jgi:hypothetical protein
MRMHIVFLILNEFKLIWKHEKNGLYSVQTGYNMDGEWSAKVTPKVRTLIWRICRGCFPTSKTLNERHVLFPLNCEMCPEREDDEWHICFHFTSLQCCDPVGLQWFNSIVEVLLDICAIEVE